MPNRLHRPNFSYNALKFALRSYMRIFHRLRIVGQENIPDGGPVIVAANHISNWDPPVLGAAIPWQRAIHFMAKEELFNNPIVNWLITKLRAFPVRRGMADREAIRNAVQRLENGNILGIFPQGTRRKHGEDQWKGEPGLAMLALKTGATIVPAAIIGTDGKSLFSQFIVVFGPPILVDRRVTGKEAIEQLTGRVMQQIQAMVEKEMANRQNIH